MYLPAICIAECFLPGERLVRGRYRQIFTVSGIGFGRGCGAFAVRRCLGRLAIAWRVAIGCPRRAYRELEFAFLAVIRGGDREPSEWSRQAKFHGADPQHVVTSNPSQAKLQGGK